jgi:chromosome segregation ATPase
MKETLIVAVVPFALLGASTAFAGTQSCDTKVAAIEAQIQKAQLYGNVNKVAGLQQALAEAKARCSDAGQLARAEAEVQRKQESGRHAQEDVRRAEEQLRNAKASGDAKRIAKAQDKLRGSKAKLSEKMEKLREAQADLEALKA